MNIYRKTSIVVGILMLSAFFLYGNGTLMIPGLEGIGTFLILLNTLAVVSIGVLLYPILERQNPTIALGYTVTRVLEGLFLAVGALFLTLQKLPDLPRSFSQIGNMQAYLMGMFILGIGSLFFCYSMMKSKIIPYGLALWGFIGYFLLSLGCALDLILGLNISLYFLVPGGLFEFVFALWLIIKGFGEEPIKQ